MAALSWASLAAANVAASSDRSGSHTAVDGHGDGPTWAELAEADGSEESGSEGGAESVVDIRPSYVAGGSQASKPRGRKRALHALFAGGCVGGADQQSAAKHRQQSPCKRGCVPSEQPLVLVDPSASAGVQVAALGGESQPRRLDKITMQAVALCQYVRFVPSALLQFVDAWVASAKKGLGLGQSDEQVDLSALDEDTRSIAKLLYGVGGSAAAPMSTQALCDQASVTRDRFLRREIRLASAVLLCSMRAQQAFERALHSAAVQGQLRLLCIIEFRRYDETPMHVRTSRPDHNDGKTELGFGISAGDIPDEFRAAFFAALACRAEKPAGAAKLLHVEHSYGYLVGWTDSVGALSTSFLFWRPQRRLFVLERCTAEVLREAVRRSSTLSLPSLHFEQKFSLFCGDKFAGNERCEQAVASDRVAHGFGAPALFDCELHIVSTIHGATFHKLMPNAVSGIIRVALSLATAADLARFQKVLRKLAMERLQIRHGCPPTAATEWRLNALRLFSARGAKAVMRMVTLAYLPNGDWRKPKTLEIFVTREVRERLGDDRLRRMVAAGIEAACASCCPLVYNRHRWTGLDLCLDYLGRLSVMNGLLEDAFLEFAKSFHTGFPGDQAGRSADIASNAPSLSHITSGGREQGIDGGEVLVALPEAAPGDSIGIETNLGEGAGGDTSTWQEERVQNRRAALAFMMDSPLEKLVLLRLAVEPLRSLLTAKFMVASPEWDAKSRCADLPSSADGGEAPGDERAQFRVLVSALNVHERQALDKLSLLFKEESLWELMPQDSHREDVSTLAFRVLSRQGGLIEQLLMDGHRRYPFRLFTALLSEREAERLSADPQCIKDQFSSQWCMRNDMRSAEGKAILAALAMMIRCEIAAIESLHASMRRVIQVMGMHTYAPAFASVSARWSAARFAPKEGKKKASPTVSATSSAGDADVASEASGGKRTKGGGGPWRAFVYRESCGERGVPDLRQLADRYHELDQAQREQLQVQGARATRQHRLDPHGRSFGVSKADVHQHLQKHGDLVRAEQASRMQGDFQKNFQLASGVVASCDMATFGEGLSAARRQQRAMATCVAKRTKARVEMLAAFAPDGWREARARFASILPKSIVDWAKSARAIPSRCFPVFELDANIFGDAAALAAWSSRRPVANAEFDAGFPSHVGGALALDWCARHDALSHEKAEPIKTAKKGRGGRCWVAGYCTCKGVGAKLALFRARLLKALSVCFPASQKGCRLKLLDGYIVLRLAGRQESPEGNVGEVEHFWHVCCMYQRPWRPTLHNMVFVGVEPGGEGLVRLQASCVWQTLWRAIEDFDLNFAWTMHVMEIVERARPIPKMTPSEIVVRRLHTMAGEAVAVWPPPGRAARVSADPLVAVPHDVAEDEEEGLVSGEPIDDDGDECTDTDCDDGGGDLGEPDHQHPADLLIDAGVVEEEEEAGEEPVGGTQPAMASDAAAASSDRGGRHVDAGVRGAAECTLVLPGWGRISYYASKEAFEARCCQADHGRSCAKTRTARPSASKRQQGRPLGYLAAWLMTPCSTKDQHARVDTVDEGLTYEQRAVVRALLREEHEEFAELEGFERDQRDDEIEEPEQCP